LVAFEARGLEGQYKMLEDSVKEELRSLRESVREELRSLRLCVLQECPARQKTPGEQPLRCVGIVPEDEKEVREKCRRELESWVAQQEAAHNVSTKVAEASVLRCCEQLGLSSIRAALVGLNGYKGDGGIGAHCMETAGSGKKSTGSFVETTMAGCPGEVEDEFNAAPAVVFTPKTTKRSGSVAIGVDPPLQQTQQQQQVQPQQQPQLQQTQQSLQRSASSPRQSCSVPHPIAGTKGLSCVPPAQRRSVPSIATSPPTPSCVMSPQCGSPRPVLASESKLHPVCVSPRKTLFQKKQSQIFS